MTILSACTEAALELLGSDSVPSTLFSTTDEFAVELRMLANKTATAVAKAHDWRRLTILNTQEGDGEETSFTLPTDYDRMPLKADVWSSAQQQPMTRVDELDHWLHMGLADTWAGNGCWILLGGTLQIMPAMSADESAKHYYLSKYIWTAGGRLPGQQGRGDRGRGRVRAAGAPHHARRHLALEEDEGEGIRRRPQRL